ncbi:M20/M25/M40 family metallo-hydrolase [Murimonas intestini]|uniref:M20/M25/M40 family metallo-hydrolase n=1 Tax=Murimonas intestini TaxID=1337051 RepID=UPI0011DE4C8C|nr:M20/M25/M40 family metallo-hydrolase [Murimonas intestini]
MAIFILITILCILIILLAVVTIRAVLCKVSARSLKEKEKKGTPESEEYYSKRLARLISCETVSHKDSYDDTEFSKLRTVIQELFPVMSRRASLRIFGDDCYVYMIPGKDTARNVMVMSHHDVAPVSGGWKYPPFSGKVAEGCIWGRGTVDTKTPLFAEFSAIEELLNEGFEPACNIYLASSHNEEIAGDGIPLAVSYFRKEGIRFEWILDEGGAVIDAPMSGISCKCAMLAVHEKGRHTINLTAGKSSGHEGLMAKTDTPEVRMASFISRVHSHPPFIRRISPQLRAMFDGLAPYMSFPMRIIFANMWLFGGLLKRIIPAMNEQAGAMLGTSGTFKNINTAEDGSCRAELFLRCVNEDDLSAEIEILQKTAADYGIVMSDAKEGNEYYPPASLESTGYKYIKSCVEKYFDYVACAPFILPAGTDARHFGRLCDAVIRFAPIDINNQQFKSVHGIDENISTESVVQAVGFYKELIKGI